MSHTANSAFCRSIKLQVSCTPSREVAICLDPYCGLGFTLGAFAGRAWWWQRRETQIALTQSFSKLFKDLGLHPRAVSTSFGCRVNLAICLQGTSGPDPTTGDVDMRALRA
ncbi:hypothetical protein DPEC_G00134250 [Dallia pectoralis]|uniref:Uncharacterized protein n=1 Tax=Dallia pectoralis TaxID=75939 RepID=A0ACC2GRF1_DALPE|nr:hypothetical protein DPEC_G00134250 [Dallia pectoralis]